MKKVSRILIAYDGSSCSDAALIDLGRAGLPQTLEATVVTVADIILPPPDEELTADDVPAVRIVEVERYAKVRAEKARKEAQLFADQGAAKVKKQFPTWNVKTEVRCDSPAWALLELAARLNPDLIVIGSHGHSSIGGRLNLGSVSQKVLNEAQCSVRVARSSETERTGPVRLLVGFNGLHDSEVAVDSVMSREWPAGSEVRLITAHSRLDSELRHIAAERLREVGLETAEVSKEGNPARVLMSEAEAWNADSIFVGTRDVHGLQHLLQGSVSSTVAEQARCTVEVSRATSSSQASVAKG